MEEYDRNRRRSKTFSEMMEERNSRGRKSSLVLYKDDDANDLSDLGIGASDKSLISEDYEHNEKEETDRKLHVNQNGKQGKNGHHDDDASSAATVSSPEPEEYTYERAIQGYVNFAEARVKSRTAVTRTNLNSSIEQLEKSHILESSPEKMSNGHHTKGLPSPPHTPRRQSGAKIEEKLSALEKRRHSSTELNSNTVNGKKMPMVKGDVLKRREMFERACELSEQVSKPGRRLLEGNQDSLSHSTNKDKEKVMLKSSENINGKDSAQLRHRFSNGDLSSTSSVQKRLSQLENKGENEQMSGNLSQSVKERLSNLDSAYNKDGHMNSTAEKDPSLQAKLTNLHSTEEKAFNGIDSIKDPGVGSVRSSSPEEDVIYETKRQQFHRSLDSLDVEGSTDVCNDAFERVQSLEDLDCCRHARNYPASASSTEMLVFSSQSGDTDRDDSGIHTADVSCSVSQADEPVDDGEIITTINSVVPHLETSSSGVDIYHLEVEIVNQKHLGSQRADQKSPVSDPSHNFAADPTEMTTAFLDVKGNLGSLAPVVAKVGVQQVLDSKGNSEPEQFKQEIMLLNYMAGCEEHDVYNEKCDAQHKLEDVNIPNVNVENVKQEGNSALKSCSNVKQLPSSESFTQNVPSDVKEEEKSSVLGSLPRNCDEDVFLPITTIQIPPLNLSSDVEIVSELAFPLGPPTSTEPPKEKPPPPPTELSDDEVPPVTSLKRLDSTKRIKKEMWRKRSDFLGIEGGNDDSYLEPELKVAPPPDMTTFLVEERRSEQQLYRQSICSETDSNHGETTDSRDSGVELERAHSDDWLGKLSLTPDVLSAQHSRQNSDIYGTASITSEEDEIMKKEREIIEILEKEEQWQYRNIKTSEEKDIGEKLTVKLHQLEQEKMRLEWERLEEEEKRQMKENACREEDLRLRAKEQELKQQESLIASPKKRPSVTGKEERVTSTSGEALRAERERLQRESEELQRQKETLQLRESQQLRHNLSQMQQHWGSTTALPHQQWGTETTGLPPTHLSLQDISMAPTGNINSYHPPTSPMAQSSAPLNYRLSLPDLQHEEQLQSQQLLIRPGSMMPAPTRRPPPPIPPAKPLRAVSQEQKERENSIRNSRMPSADSIPQNVDSTNVHNSSVPAHTGAQPISRQTLQALSAVPRSRFISNDMWMQAKKKPENQRSGGRESTYNYQHWLIQEAEHRRITEQQQRTAVSPRKPSPPHSQPHTPLWNTPQPQPRQEKPLPDAIIQTLTQRVQNRVGMLDNKSSVSGRRRLEDTSSRESQSQAPAAGHMPNNGSTPSSNSAVTCGDSQEKMLSVSGKKKCSHCGEELGRGAAMIIESLRLFYHIDCFKCCVCHVQLGDGLMGTDVRVRNNKLHCHNCYSSDDGVKFSCV
ncbi:uncharacterized protein LOC110841474 isoform X5 [Zootermopsis nevadensis]|uniref:uncharacterized protein LOC110841474 isoform X5 n=1 Tax=Zootermopsis nevadensis TaxID=136037 RepID=UPI000B8E88CB|nr:uncharacterized protein LOC110841474 isoform X5 [Zootermopsis nevadensis]